jgi:hypothetical protein
LFVLNAANWRLFPFSNFLFSKFPKINFSSIFTFKQEHKKCVIVWDHDGVMWSADLWIHSFFFIKKENDNVHF